MGPFINIKIFLIMERFFPSSSHPKAPTYRSNFILWALRNSQLLAHGTTDRPNRTPTSRNAGGAAAYWSCPEKENVYISNHHESEPTFTLGPRQKLSQKGTAKWMEFLEAQACECFSPVCTWFQQQQRNNSFEWNGEHWRRNLGPCLWGISRSWTCNRMGLVKFVMVISEQRQKLQNGAAENR